MIFGPVEIEEALGHVLAHNVVDDAGRRRLRKGSKVSEKDLGVLRELELRHVWTAQLEPGDIDEDAAALSIATALMKSQDTEPGATAAKELTFVGPRTGRVNLKSTYNGIVQVNQERVNAVNQFDGITLATMAPFASVDAGRVVATVKILPYALPQEVVQAALDAVSLAGVKPAVEVLPLRPTRVALIMAGSESGRERSLPGFERSLGERLQRLGSQLHFIDYVVQRSQTTDELARTLQTTSNASDLILLAGETAIQDRHDIAPSAIEQAGGSVTCFGAPVDPGNLLLLGKVGKAVVLGVPGCARSPKANIVDLLLPRLLAGIQVSASDVATLGVGGLLDDVAERPLPRALI